MDKDLFEVDLIQKILVRLPVVSLLRCKSVCKSWCALIQSSFFIHLHTTATNSKSSSSSRFGSFIVHVSVEFPKRFREDALFMFSSESESESECCVVSRSLSWCSESFGLWSTGFNGICGECLSKLCDCELPGSGGEWWRTSDGLCCQCLSSNNFVVEEEDNNPYLGSFLGGGGGGGDVSNEELVLKLENLRFPSCYNFGKTNVMVVGSCNGLICLYDEQSNDVSLWNPATRQFRILPKSITFDGDCLHHRLFAFGFDAETKDYKVVLLSGFSLRPRRIIDDDGGLSAVVVVGPMECLCRVQVYSLSTDSWWLLEGINVLPGAPFFNPSDSSCGQLLYLNGRCFFMAKFHHPQEEEEEEQQCIPAIKDDYRFIISLDLTTRIITDESIIPIQLPVNINAGEELYLCYLGKKIALITASVYQGWEFFYIWVLNEHGSLNYESESSWTRLDSFRIKHGFPGEWIIPRGISNDGVFVFLETGIHGLGNKKKKMKLYNLVVTQEVKENFIYCDQVLSKAYAYKPSLVSIIGGGNGCSYDIE